MSKWSRPFSSFDHNIVSTSKPTRTCYTYRPSHPSPYLAASSLQIMRLVITTFPLTYCHFPSLRSKYSARAQTHTHTHNHTHAYININTHTHTLISWIKIPSLSSLECSDDTSRMHLSYPTILASLVYLRKLNSHLYGKLIGTVTSCVLGHGLCNCGTRTTAGMPTAIFWYAILI